MAGPFQITSFDSVGDDKSATAGDSIEMPEAVELDNGDELDIHLLFALMPVFFEECTRSSKSFHKEHYHGMALPSVIQ
jgi:hypothetical protein